MSTEHTPEALARGMFHADRCDLCREYGEKVRPWLCAGCAEVIPALGYVRASDYDALRAQADALATAIEQEESKWVMTLAVRTALNAYRATPGAP